MSRLRILLLSVFCLISKIAFSAPLFDCRYIYEKKLTTINSRLPPEKQWRIVEIRRVAEPPLFAWSEPSGFFWDEITYINDERHLAGQPGVLVKRQQKPGAYTLSGWDLRDSTPAKDKASFFFSATDKNSSLGVINFGVRSKRRSGPEREGVVMSAREELVDALQYFPRTWAIQDVWVKEDGVPSDNLAQYNEALSHFSPPYSDEALKAAALSTWTGKQAIALGFTSVEIVPNTLLWDAKTQNYSVASFLFKLP